MSETATARAQAEDALDEAAKALKRQIGVSRKALQAVRQAQAIVVGITVTNHSQEAQNAGSEEEAGSRS